MCQQKFWFFSFGELCPLSLCLPAAALHFVATIAILRCSVTESNSTGGKVGKAGIAGKLGQTDKTCLQLETPVGSWE